PDITGDARLAAGVHLALAGLPGIAAASVNPVTGRALLVFATPIDDLEHLLDEIGRIARAAEPLEQPVAPAADGETHESDGAVQLDWLRVIGGAVAVGTLAAIRLAGGPLALAAPPVAAIATGAALLVGIPTFINGIRPLLRCESPEIDTLITTATFASLLVGEAATGLVVVWLIALGELVEDLTLARTRRAIGDLLAVGEEWAWVILPGGQEVRVRREELEPGATVVVHAGDKIPVDGIVVEGGASVNQAPITGESMPVFRNPGDEVFAGTVVAGGSLHVRAARVGPDTAIGRIIALVEEAREVQAPIQRLADRFSRRIVPLSFLLAGGVFAATGNVLRSMTILVIACPCAAGLATPTAVSAAIAHAARRGILIKGGLHLETAGSVDAVVFDKTGTLTSGAPRVQQVVATDERYTAERVLALAASGELHSQHPLAAAVLQLTQEREIEIPPHSEYEIIVGHGVRFAVDGARLVIGSRHMLDDFGVPVSREQESTAQRLRERGQSILWVAEAPTDATVPAAHLVKGHPEDGAVPAPAVAPQREGPGRVVGLIGVADFIRPEAIQALEELRKAGVAELHMITGDSREAADMVAAHLGISRERVTAEAMPDEKLRLVRRLQAAGRTVALVGDGVNDAPALAAANLGIAMGHGGADVALEAADVALAADDIRHVAEVIILSRRTMGLVRQNFAFSLGINGIGVVAGAFGLLSPFAAAVVHNLSTVAVVLNSGRLLTR
ncbi:MAG TPA: cation-translocating P-type ATPase, partial [Chloroflexota bacterium]|nr:cation-translocating P-type ATPase [Chloroflexota bacterium]